jgi:transcription antitermination factor NusG
MAILAKEPNVFPPDLFIGESLESLGANLEASLEASFGTDFEDGESRRWLTVYTKSRQEKSLARELVKNEIPFYLPMAPFERLSRGRRLKTYSPLFSGYVFFYGTEEERIKMLGTNRVSRLLPVADEAQLYRDLLNISALVESGAPLTVEQRLEKGRRVRVKYGSLMGLEGTIIQRRGVDRFLVEVNYIQQGVSIQLDHFMVEPI